MFGSLSLGSFYPIRPLNSIKTPDFWVIKTVSACSAESSRSRRDASLLVCLLDGVVGCEFFFTFMPYIGVSSLELL